MGTVAQPVEWVPLPSPFIGKQEVTGQRRFGETSGFILLKSIFSLFGPPQQTPAVPTGCREG